MSEVSELLARSMALHNLAKPVTTGKAANRRTTKGRDLEKLREAYQLRKKAHAKDRKHADPAWADEQLATPIGHDTHAALMAFYADQGLADG